MRPTPWLAFLPLALALLPTLGGCAQVRVTDPDRTATEQFLLSEAAAQAVQQLSADALRDRHVYIDRLYFESTDEEFVLGELRAHLLLNGVRLTNDRDEAQIVVEPRTRGVGIDRYDYLLGLPQVFLPAGEVGGVDAGGGTVIVPELAILKRLRQRGFASVSFVAYWRDSGEVIHSSGPFVGRTEREDWWFFGIGPRTSGNVAPAEEEDAP
ncbi:MAG: DUF6655 family protein [Phycisphaeraceae bacterium]